MAMALGGQTGGKQTELTWFQFFLEPAGNFFQRFTRRTQALQISPERVSHRLKKAKPYVSVQKTGREKKYMNTIKKADTVNHYY